MLTEKLNEAEETQRILQKDCETYKKVLAETVRLDLTGLCRFQSLCGARSNFPAVSTGGHLTATPEQRGAGGVSLEGEAGGFTGRTQSSTYEVLLTPMSVT